MPKNIEKSVAESLFELQDVEYKDFHSKLVPTVDKALIIGVRTPILRKFSATFSKNIDHAQAFMSALPHHYYEENNVHGFLIERIGDFDQTIEALDVFLPYIDNWATCDLINPKVFRKNKEALLSHAKRWMCDTHTYTCRFGIGVMMRHFLDADFCLEYAEEIAKISSDEYYVKMMVAWYFATALAKQYDAVFSLIKAQRLAPWTHNKAIQKAIESYRISPEQKAELRKLKV